MRALLIAQSLRPDAASPAHSLVGLVPQLEGRGIQTTLLAADMTGAEALGFDASSVNAAHAQEPVACVGAHDLVHVFGWGYPLSAKVITAVGLQRKPFLVSPFGSLDRLREQSLGDRIRWWFSGRRTLAKARCLAAANDWEAERLREFMPAAHIEILPPGLPTESFEPPRAGLPKAGLAPQPYVLVLGPVDPPSGAVALLKALAEIGPDADGWSVVFAGPLERHWRQMLEAAIRRKGGEARVRFNNDPDLPTQRALLAGCGMLVAPALRSRPSIAMMQAIAAGIPACGTKCAAPPEIDCLACEPNRTAMRDMLRTMLRQSDLDRRATALRLQEQAKGQLAWPAIIDRCVTLYRRISEPRP